MAIVMVMLLFVSGLGLQSAAKKGGNFGEGLVGWWKFDEGEGDIAYDSAGDNDGTLIGDPNWTAGQIDGALDFNGVLDYVRTANNIFFDAQLAFGATLTAWFRTDMSAYALIADDEGYVALLMNLPGYENKVSGTVDGGYNLYCSCSNVNDDLWHHVALVWDGSGNAVLYLDGEPEDSGPSGAPTPDDADRPFTIGNHSTEGPYYFDGLIDDVRFYGQALSAEEIWQLYQQGLE